MINPPIKIYANYIITLMFLETKEELLMLNHFMEQNPDCNELLADALIYCYLRYPDRYDEMVKNKDYELKNIVSNI
jgi:hypothetical protein